MSSKTSAGAPAPTEPRLEVEGAPPGGRSLVERVLRWILGLVALLVVVGTLAHLLRPELEQVGRAFVARFGVFGMAFGTFLADGFHFPVPPQFYMLMAIAGGGSVVLALLAITIGSLCGGVVAFFLSQYIGKWRFVARLIARSAPLVERLGMRHGYRAAVIASLTPIAFSMLCYLAGIYRFPRRVFFVFLLLRIPKILLYFYLVRLGWGLG